MRSLLFLAFVPLLCVASCSSSQSPPAALTDDGGGPVRGDYDPVPFGGSRPVKLYVPSGYTGAPTPLVIMLHGYSASGDLEEIYLGLRQVAEAKTVLYAHPDGTINPAGYRFWNATDACCDFYGSNVDDSAYLTALVKEIGTRYAVDPDRVYFIGHSNGGYMSYRMACDHADMVAAIVSIAGAMWQDTSRCKPSAPVSVLEVHGTADNEVLYNGAPAVVTDAGMSAAGYPGATTSVADWATFDGCATPPDTSQPPIDIDGSIAGAETHVTRYAAGCRAGSEVDLWTIQGEGHIPGFNPSFAPMAFDFLLAHKRQH